MRHGNIELLNMDCMTMLREAKDNEWDLAIVDPQYGIGESMKTQSRPLMAKQKNGTRLYVSSARKHAVKEWDKERPSPEYFEQIRRVSKNQIIWGGNHFADLLPKSTGWIVWDKCNDESDQSDCELAWTSFDCGVRIIRYMWNGFLQGSASNGKIAEGNKKLNEERIHPTQKPTYIFRWLLNRHAKQSDRIVDTHAGSFPLGLACHDYGFALTATELDKDYYEDACKRFRGHVAQTKLFPVGGESKLNELL